MSTIMGIDPGLDGGIAWSFHGAMPSVSTMPTIEGRKRIIDLSEIVARVRLVAPTLVVMEEVNAAPMRGRRQGTGSMFAFGRGFGQIEGILTALGVPYELVKPQTWKRHILAGTAKDKQAAVAWCKRRYPGVSLLATPRCRTPHDGMADALCLAEYGRRLCGKGVA